MVLTLVFFSGGFIHSRRRSYYLLLYYLNGDPKCRENCPKSQRSVDNAKNGPQESPQRYYAVVRLDTALERFPLKTLRPLGKNRSSWLMPRDGTLPLSVWNKTTTLPNAPHPFQAAPYGNQATYRRTLQSHRTAVRSVDG